MSEVGLAKLRGVLRRRRLPIVVAVVGVIGVGGAIISQIEPGFRAQAVIRVAEAQPAREYVAPTVAEQIGERLKSLRLSVMARPLLVEAARQLDLFKHTRQSPDEVIEGIRARMDVKVEGEDTFLLIYADSTGERAQAVVNKVAELFMQHHVEGRQRIATATVQALQSEVDTMRPDLEAAEGRVRDFKLAHYGALPEQTEGNLRQLDQSTMEINIQSTNLDMDLERRRALMAAALSPLRHHEETLAGQLYESRAKYTDDNPEVQKNRAEYERVKALRIADEQDLYHKVRRANPEMVALDGEIARTKAMIDGLRGRMNEVRKRVEATAKNGHELAVLQVAYEARRDKYNTIISRLRDAQLAESLERGLAPLRLDLVEGAAIPTHAAAPNRPLLSFGVLVLALALGVGLGFALDAGDTSLHDAEHVRLVAPNVPILAAVPRAGFRTPNGSETTPKAEA